MVKHEEPTNHGEDSFLDTIANLVGILIILVVLIGGQTKVQAEAKSREIAQQDIIDEALEPAAEAERLHSAALQNVKELEQYVLETEYRRIERDRLLDLKLAAKADIEERISKVDAKQRERIEKTNQLDELQSQLKEIGDRLSTPEETKREKVVLEHLPTPMAKTVFTREMHVRLKKGRVNVIPWDQLVSMLKEQAPMAARRAASKKSIEDRLGPVGGFIMHYRMSAIPGGFELERFEIDITPENVGETLEESLASGGTLRGEISGRIPAETVVTVWVYPDSFGEFRKLKTALYREGFLAAARPLPPDVLIGASPRGSRSAAQ